MNRLENPLNQSTDYYILGCMIDLKMEQPVTEEVEVDPETLAAIDIGIKAADEDEMVSLDDVRKMMPKWISKFESQSQR